VVRKDGMVGKRGAHGEKNFEGFLKIKFTVFTEDSGHVCTKFRYSIWFHLHTRSI